MDRPLSSEVVIFWLSNPPLHMVKNIPTLEYLRKFALWRAGSPADEVIDLTSGRPMAIVIGAVLCGKAKADRRVYRRPKSYSADLQIRINSRRLNHSRRTHITVEGIRLINAFIRAQLTETLYERIDQRKALQPDRYEKDIILDFMFEVGIYEDITFSGLKKRIDRKRAEYGREPVTIPPPETKAVCSPESPLSVQDSTSQASS